MTATASVIQPNIPTAKESAIAQESSRILAHYVECAKQPSIQVTNKGKTQQVILPQSALRLLVDILLQMAEGNAVTLLPIHAELTTQEAADLLNVSRPHLVSLLEAKAIPHRKVGTRRRVLAKDVLQYKANIDQNRLDVLEELTKQGQDLKMGYEE